MPHCCSEPCTVPIAHNEVPHSMVWPPRPLFSASSFRSLQPNSLQFLKCAKALSCLCLCQVLCPQCPFLLVLLVNSQLLIFQGSALLSLTPENITRACGGAIRWSCALLLLSAQTSLCLVLSATWTLSREAFCVVLENRLQS